MKELNPSFREAIVNDFEYIWQTHVTEELLNRLTDARMRALALGDVSEAERNQKIGYAHGVADALAAVHDAMSRTVNEELE